MIKKTKQKNSLEWKICSTFIVLEKCEVVYSISDQVYVNAFVKNKQEKYIWKLLFAAWAWVKSPTCMKKETTVSNGLVAPPSGVLK